MRTGLAAILVIGFLVFPFGRDPALAADQAFFEGFIQALQDRNYEELARYVSPREKFFRDGKLQDDIDNFAYDGDWNRQFDPIGKSLLEIVSMGPFEIVSIEQADGRMTFLLFPEVFFGERSQDGFHQDQWMRKYIACEFSPIDGAYKMTWNFCFAETGGPYHRPYG